MHLLASRLWLWSLPIKSSKFRAGTELRESAEELSMLCMPEVWFDPELHIPLNTAWSVESGIAPELSGSGLQTKKQKGKKKKKVTSSP